MHDCKKKTNKQSLAILAVWFSIFVNLDMLRSWGTLQTFFLGDTTETIFGRYECISMELSSFTEQSHLRVELLGSTWKVRFPIFFQKLFGQGGPMAEDLQNLQMPCSTLSKMRVQSSLPVSRIKHVGNEWKCSRFVEPKTKQTDHQIQPSRVFPFL